MATKKVIPLRLGKQFTGFSDLYPTLASFLDQVKQAASTGSTVPSKTTGVKAPLFITDKGSAAYGQASVGKTVYGDAPDPQTGKPVVKSQVDGAKQVIQKLVQTLTTTQVGYLSGVGFTGNPVPKAPPTLTSNQNDIVNAVFSSWDKSASAYMKNDGTTGDSQKSALKTLLGHYDTAVQTLGKTAAPASS